MTDLANPSPPPGGNPSPPAERGPVAEARITGSADARMRAGARQDKASPVGLAGATPVRDNWITAGIIGVFAATTGLSWLGWFDLGVACGWPKQLAWVLPIMVDVYGFTAARVWLQVRWVSRETRWYAAFSATLAIAVSVSAQLAERWMTDSKMTAAPVWVALATSVLAPVMLGLVVHLYARMNADRAKIAAEAAEAEAARAEVERADAARVAADRAAAERAAAEEAASARRTEADLAATRRAEAAAARAAQRARAAAADGPQTDHMAHGPDTPGGPSAGRPDSDMAHGPDDVDHAADGPDDDPGDARPPGVLPPADQPDEPEMPGDVFAKARNMYRQSCRDGKAIADRPLGAQFGHSRNWGATRIKEVKQGVHLAAAAGQ